MGTHGAGCRFRGTCRGHPPSRCGKREARASLASRGSKLISWELKPRCFPEAGELGALAPGSVWPGTATAARNSQARWWRPVPFSRHGSGRVSGTAGKVLVPAPSQVARDLRQTWPPLPRPPCWEGRGSSDLWEPPLSPRRMFWAMLCVAIFGEN